jgi:hypothetical protein
MIRGERSATRSTGYASTSAGDRRGERWSPELVRAIASGLSTVADRLPSRASSAGEETKPFCVACGRPIVGAFLRDEGDAFHPTCFDASPRGRCPICGGSLRAGYYQNERGDRVCLRHEGVEGWCRFCHAPALAATLPRGLDAREGPVCPPCGTAAVVTDAAAQPLVAEVIRWLPSQGMTFAEPLRLTVALADEVTIEENRPAEDPDTYGRVFLQVWHRDGQTVRARPTKILLLQGLPAVLLQSVAAHELGHVWLASAGALDLAPLEEEGFCELLAHRWLRSRDVREATIHATHVEHQRDPLYGAGFRRLATLADSVGWAEIVRSLRQVGRLPAA